jgi:predicted protein tyrosine phosphatase
MENRPNILLVCGKNKKRSRTAEFIFKNDSRFNIRSVGVSPNSIRKITENDLNWSDLVLVMENEHKSKIKELFRKINNIKIEVLNIEDEFEFMDEELVIILTEAINDRININFGI